MLYDITAASAGKNEGLSEVCAAIIVFKEACVFSFGNSLFSLKFVTSICKVWKGLPITHLRTIFNALSTRGSR